MSPTGFFLRSPAYEVFRKEYKFYTFTLEIFKLYFWSMLLSFTSKLPEFGFPFASGVDLWRSWWHPGKGLLCYLTILGEDFSSNVWIKFNFAYFFFLVVFYLTRNFQIFWPMNLQNHVKNISPGFTWLYRWERQMKERKNQFPLILMPAGGLFSCEKSINSSVLSIN